MTVEPIEIEYQAVVEYSSLRRLEGMRITSLEKRSQIEPIISKALETELPEALRRSYDMETTVKITSTRYGSLIITFSVFLTVLGVASQYKDLYESIQLILYQARNILRKALSGNGEYDISINYTTSKMLSDNRGIPPESIIEQSLTRGASFGSGINSMLVFLLVVFTLQLVIIIILVGIAVFRTLF